MTNIKLGIGNFGRNVEEKGKLIQVWFCFYKEKKKHSARWQTKWMDVSAGVTWIVLCTFFKQIY